MKFVNTKKLENSKGQVSKDNVAQNTIKDSTKSNLDKRFETLGKAGITDKKCAINITLDNKILHKLNAYCSKHFSSRSAVINRLISDWIDNQKD